MEIKNSPHLASDSGACVPSSLRQQKTGVHGRAWVLDTHMCTSAHIQTTHTHTAHKHACTCTHTHNPRLVNCLHPPTGTPSHLPANPSAGQGGPVVGPPPSRSTSEHPALGPTSLLLFLGWTGFLTSSRRSIPDLKLQVCKIGHHHLIH